MKRNSMLKMRVTELFLRNLNKNGMVEKLS